FPALGVGADRWRGAGGLERRRLPSVALVGLSVQTPYLRPELPGFRARTQPRADPRRGLSLVQQTWWPTRPALSRRGVGRQQSCFGNLGACPRLRHRYLGTRRLRPVRVLRSVGRSLTATLGQAGS